MKQDLCVYSMVFLSTQKTATLHITHWKPTTGKLKNSNIYLQYFSHDTFFIGKGTKIGTLL
jgi:hypothetical protein